MARKEGDKKGVAVRLDGSVKRISGDTVAISDAMFVRGLWSEERSVSRAALTTTGLSAGPLEWNQQLVTL